jgi:flavodoxin-like protein
MSRILITYYSRSGYTRRVAESLGQLLDARVTTIEERRSRDGVFGYLRSAWDALRYRDADIAAPSVEPGHFDLVLIGTPVWASHPSSPARTFARRQRGRIKRVAFFCTLGGSGANAALDELQQVLGLAPLATLALTDKEIDSGSADAKLQAFAATLLVNVTPPVAFKRAA